MEDEEGNNQVTMADVWTIAIAVVMLALFAVAALVLLCWDTICEQIAINVLKLCFGELPTPK